jgi:ankyrin repeat protein
LASNPLFEAIDRGDDRRALEIVRENPDLARSRDDEGLTPLMHALYRDRSGVVAELRRSAPDLDVFEAAAVGDVERLRELVTDQAAANAWSGDGFTPLHLAGFFGRTEAVRYLIGAGAKVDVAATNRTFAGGAHPLHSAIAGRARDAAALLLQAGADPNATQHGGFTPLLEAAQLGDGDLAALLLRHGADPRICLDDGASAAEVARRAGNAELAAALGTRTG